MIVALLCWYEEPASWLAGCVGSLNGVADHVVAVDGADAAFPGAPRGPRSGPEPAAAIVETAAAIGIGCTVHRQANPWLGGEVEKRDFMFELGRTLTSGPQDWLMPIDADERVSQRPPDLAEQLDAMV